MILSFCFLAITASAQDSSTRNTLRLELRLSPGLSPESSVSSSLSYSPFLYYVRSFPIRESSKINVGIGLGYQMFRWKLNIDEERVSDLNQNFSPWVLKGSDFIGTEAGILSIGFEEEVWRSARTRNSLSISACYALNAYTDWGQEYSFGVFLDSNNNPSGGDSAIDVFRITKKSVKEEGNYLFRSSLQLGAQFHFQPTHYKTHWSLGMGYTFTLGSLGPVNFAIRKAGGGEDNFTDTWRLNYFNLHLGFHW